MGSSSAKKLILVVLKVLVSGGLLFYILRKAGLEKVAAHFREMNPWFFLLASLNYVLLITLTAVRWRILLGEGHRQGRILSLTLIGSLFNNILPSAVGGDAVKVYYLYRETREGGKALGSVFMDRYIGYAGLLSIGLAAGLTAFGKLAAVGLQWIAPLLFAAFLAGSVVVFGIRIGRRFSTVANFYDYFHDTIRNGPVVAKAYALSLAVQTLTVLSVYIIARGMGQRPPLAELFVFVPVVLTVIMVPISISGLGLRESAFVLLFGMIGIPPEAATSISFLWFLSVAAGSLPGLVEYLRYRKDRSLPGA